MGESNIDCVAIPALLIYPQVEAGKLVKDVLSMKGTGNSRQERNRIGVNYKIGL
jgi:hypothetical protein